VSASGELRRALGAEHLAGFGEVEGAPRTDPEAFFRQGADATWLLGEAGQAQARCSLWWTSAPTLPGHRLGLVGHYAARDQAAGARLLGHACAELAGRGCTLAVGPMDGSTWRRYRLLVERGEEPVFLLEPDNPDAWPGHFRAAGFDVLAGYFSALSEDLAYEDPRAGAAATRLLRRGVRVRALEPARTAEDLRRIYAVSLASFPDNFLYTPLGEDEFLEMYRPLLPRVPPDLVLLAEDGGTPLGFVFGYPDALRAARGAAVDTVVLKTLARVPGRAWAGLGTLLVAEFIRRARALGFRRVIHALMHDSNASRNLSAQWRSRTIRRYALFARPLP
jgi:L-amino acid N-acyltransferase YncA